MKSNTYPEIKIGKRLISINHKPLIVPEMGINHNGSLEIAFNIVDAAKKSGAEIIKHQTHVPEDEMSIEAKKIKQSYLMDELDTSSDDSEFDDEVFSEK